MNFLPARLSGFVTVVAAFLLGLRSRESWQVFKRDRRQHSSPNAGQTEAAFAGALGIMLGGSSIYFGQTVEKPTIGNHVLEADAYHIQEANRLALAVTILFTAILLAIRIIFMANFTGVF